MLSRAVFRSLPRSTSRIASYSTRAAFKPTLQSSLRQNAAISSRLQPLRAAFSVSSRRRDDIGQELSAKLDSEIALESDNSESQHDSDGNIKNFLEQNDHWEITAPDGQAEVVLKRNYDGQRR